MPNPKTPPMAGPASFGMMAPGGKAPATPQANVQNSQPKSPGGKGFLINHNAFSDARPPAARGMKKSAGYPSFAKKNP